MLYIHNKTKNTVSAVTLIDTTQTMTLEHGEYDFKVAGWDGAKPLEGNLKCGSTTANLKDPTAQVEIAITSANCSTSKFSPAAYTSGSNLNPLRFISCLSLSSVNTSGSVCDSTLRGSTSSYRIKMVSFKDIPFGSSPSLSTGLSSDCIPAMSAPSSLTPVSIKIPYGSSEAMLATVVETYGDAACTTGKISHYFPQGLAYPSSNNTSESYVFGSNTDFYFEHNLTPPLTLSSIFMTSNNMNQMWAKVGDTVSINFTANSSTTNFNATINNQPATVTNLGAGNYKAQYTFNAVDFEGMVSFEITSGGVIFNSTTDFQYVTFDKTANIPSITLSYPGTSVGNVNNPSFFISGLESTTEAQLYGDPTCSVMLATSQVSGGSITLGTTVSPGPHNFYAKQVDRAGNISGCSSPAFYDYQMTALSSVTMQSSNAMPHLAKIGDNIILNFTANAPSTFTATINGNPAPVNNIGGLNYQAIHGVTAGDVDGIVNFTITTGGQNFSAITSGPSVTVDKFVGQPQVSLYIPGTSADFVKNPTLRIQNLETNSLVRVYSDSGCSNFVVAGTSAGPTLDLSTGNLTPGQYSFYAYQTDEAGNASTCSVIFADYRLKHAFVSKWRTTTASETITLPLISGNTYNFTVDWGDGSATNTYTSYTASHVYPVPGDYVITITGLVEAWQFNASGSALKILEVNDFGELGWKKLLYGFKGCSNLTIFNGGDVSLVQDFGYMFANATQVTPNIGTWDTSSATNMTAMFSGATAANPDVSLWNVSNVIHMTQMFMNASAAQPNTTNWITTSLMSAGSMFEYAINANPITSGWNTSNVRYMYNMFKNATLANPDVSGWNVSSVEQMDGMFQNAPNATPDVAAWDTMAVTTMSNMFNGATSANPVTSSWNLAAILHVEEMFTNSGISTVNWSNFLIMADTTTTVQGLSISSPAQYNSSAVTARTSLETGKFWTITDSGPQ